MPLNFDASQAATGVLFAGQLYDASSGTYYMRARFYDPVTGQFGSRDSAQGNPNLPLTLNAYAYADDGPTNATDPSGHGIYWAEVGIEVHDALTADFGQKFPEVDAQGRPRAQTDDNIASIVLVAEEVARGHPGPGARGGSPRHGHRLPGLRGLRLESVAHAARPPRRLERRHLRDQARQETTRSPREGFSSRATWNCSRS